MQARCCNAHQRKELERLGRLHHPPSDCQRAAQAQPRRPSRAAAQKSLARRHHAYRDVAAGSHAALCRTGSTSAAACDSLHGVLAPRANCGLRSFRARRSTPTQIYGCSLSRAPTLAWLTVGASCIIISEHGWPARSSNQTLVVLPTPELALSKSAEASCKRARLVKAHALAHHVIGRPGQLVRYRLGGHDFVGLGRLALIEALDPRV